MDERVDWNQERAERWLARSADTNRQLQPVSELLFGSAQLGSGERVIDVGCGDGPTTRAAARAVGVRGAVTGLDISATMLEAAAEVAIDGESSASIDWVAADAEVWQIPIDSFDVLISRFGVMFFDNPVRAFANLAKGMKANGRLAIATWASRDEVELFDLPYRISSDVSLRAGIQPPSMPIDGGAFSMCSRSRIAPLLQAGGWTEVLASRHVLRFQVGGGLGPTEAALVSVEQGPTRLVVEAAPHLRKLVLEALTEEYERRCSATNRVELGGTIVLTTACMPS